MKLPYDTVVVPAGAEERAIRRGLAAAPHLRVVVTRIGPIAAALAAAEALALEPRPCGVVGAGFCGILTPAFAVGEPLIYGESVAASGEIVRMSPDLVRSLAAALPDAQTGVRALDADRIVVSAAEKRALAERTPAGVVDMETLALARAFDAAGVPFASVRVGSDDAEHDLPALDRALDGSGGIDRLALLLAMGRSPLAAARLAVGASAGLRSLERIAQALASTSPVAS